MTEKGTRIYYCSDFSVAEIQAVYEVLDSYSFSSVEFAGELRTPSECFNRERQQFNADCLLDFLKRTTGEDAGFFYLWIIREDIFIPSTNFIFGQAELGGNFAVVSTARLRTGEGSESAIYLKRLRTEVVHELLHLLGFKHCPNPYCVMYFSNSISDTDRKGDELCVVCTEKLRLMRERSAKGL
jgi:archaemetzincin